jgi:hypothetical protein
MAQSGGSGLLGQPWRRRPARWPAWAWRRWLGQAGRGVGRWAGRLGTDWGMDRKNWFWIIWLLTRMNSKGNFNDFKPNFWVFSKIGIWILIQVFRSNKVELQIWNIFEIEFRNWFENSNQGIWNFNERNLNSDSKFGCKGKDFWPPFRYQGWTWIRVEI